ncbi:DoxX family protein [Pseudoflavitalea sp. G-6-1-2]|uniref:DoxX family protein n=1 Tax=Pseudoflavitalea sp. G-6-1-2 TaxID=2728841 RepID=UPI00146C386B|nr:DoxX family protein [Pseudoflavitalea sp. G-6-1-2]NML21799.1 DoxX family protein [Pseudoflavitalea sp. G-6-1-2]
MKTKLSNLLKGDLNIIRGIFYTGFVFIFGYAALFKVFEWPRMMKGMAGFGFNTNWTLFIGYAELVGTIGLLIGLAYPKILRLSILWLFPFAIGAFTVHMANEEYHHYYNSLFCCIAAVVLFLTDKKVKVTYTP